MTHTIGKSMRQAIKVNRVSLQRFVKSKDVGKNIRIPKYLDSDYLLFCESEYFDEDDSYQDFWLKWKAFERACASQRRWQSATIDGKQKQTTGKITIHSVEEVK